MHKLKINFTPSLIELTKEKKLNITLPDSSNLEDLLNKFKEYYPNLAKYLKHPDMLMATYEGKVLALSDILPKDGEIFIYFTICGG